MRWQAAKPDLGGQGSEKCQPAATPLVLLRGEKQKLVDGRPSPLLSGLIQ